MGLQSASISAAGHKAWNLSTNMMGVKGLLSHTGPAHGPAGTADTAAAAAAAAEDGAGGSPAAPAAEGLVQAERGVPASTSCSSLHPAQEGSLEEGCSLQESADGSKQLVVEDPSQLQLSRGQVLWLLMAAGLWIAGVVLVCVGIGALWGDSAAALGLVRLQWRLECCELSCRHSAPCLASHVQRGTNGPWNGAGGAICLTASSHSPLGSHIPCLLAIRSALPTAA